MTQADRIRRYAHDNYIFMARVAGSTKISICCGDVHRKMGLINSQPAVCSALRSKRFEKHYRVQRITSSGPREGATTTFVFLV